VRRDCAIRFPTPPSSADLRRLADRIPEWHDADLAAEPLPGGLTNLNYRVRGAPVDYVLRVTGDAELLGADREAEYAATTIAAGLGIGPEVLAYLRPERLLVTRFVHGRPVPPEDIRRPETIRLVARTLRRLHTAPPVPSAFSAFEIVEAYRSAAASLGVPEPADLGWARERAAELRPLLDRRGGERCLCHNDLLNANFLVEADGRLRIVDWEYAGMGDPFFDLANFSSNHELSADDDRLLLRAYGAGDSETAFARLRLMRVMSDFREAMWGVVQQGLQTTDTDFGAYAAQFFARMRERASDPAYPRWLTALGAGTGAT
jgi:thiamine kinase-like enzyme